MTIDQRRTPGWLFFFLLCCSFFLAGCAGPDRYVNTPLGGSHESVPRAGFPFSEKIPCDTPAAPECKDDIKFVGLAISGGGSRAANYAGAVMSQLDELGILQHVNVISSVSGGSVAAAYYAQRSNQPLHLEKRQVFWQKAEADLSQDFRSIFLAKFLRPDNFASSMFGSLGRTEIMAQVFDEYLFSGARFGDLEQTGPGLVINATAINALHGEIVNPANCANRHTYAQSMKWESISFTQAFFNKCLQSDISTYPIAHAVAASAAFPGVFSSVPLARFPPAPNSDKIKAAEYLHVIDGGPSDNLAIDGILSEWAAKSRSAANTRIGKCMIIVIDAFASGEVDLRNLKSDPRSVSDRFVDSNFFDSIDAMLNRRRLETLRNIKLPPPRLPYDQHRAEDFPIKGHHFEYWDGDRVVDKMNPFDVLGTDEYRTPNVDARGLPTSVGEPECMVWYIGIDSLKDLIAPDWEFSYDTDRPYPAKLDDEEREAVLTEHFASAEARNRAALWELSSRVQTDFNLTGPKNCKASVLRDALWASGRYSVNADLPSRKKVCTWLRDAGLKTADNCAEPIKLATPSLPVKYVDHAPNGYSVECE